MYKKIRRRIKIVEIKYYKSNKKGDLKNANGEWFLMTLIKVNCGCVLQNTTLCELRRVGRRSEIMSARTQWTVGQTAGGGASQTIL